MAQPRPPATFPAFIPNHPGPHLDGAAKKISRARTRLLLERPWFGALGLRLTLVEQAMPEPESAGLATDGTCLYYDPAKVLAMPEPHLLAMMGHEVMHCCLAHPYRHNGREAKTWELATDYAINPILAGAGFTLWDGALNDPQYAGMSAEQIYAKLRQAEREGQKPQPPTTPQPELRPAPKPGQGAGDGSGQPDPNAPPTDGDGQPDPNGQPQPSQGQQPRQMTEVDWEIAAQAAAMASKKAGTMDGDAERAIREARESQVPWQEYLKRFLTDQLPSDWSWVKPDRRFVGRGIYLPGVVRENVGPIGVHIDTSGSIGQPELDHAAGEVTAIVREVRPEKVIVVYCDTCVQHVEEFEPDDEIVFRPHGGGGTKFQPALDYFTELEEPVLAVCSFTDLENSDRGQLTEPAFPVLWITSESSRLEGEFGETVRIPVR